MKQIQTSKTGNVSSLEKLQMVYLQSIVPLLSYTLYPDVHSSLTLPLNFSHFLIFSTCISFQLSLSFLKSQNLWTVFGSSLQHGYFAFCILELYHDFVRFGYLVNDDCLPVLSMKPIPALHSPIPVSNPQPNKFMSGF